MPVMQESIRPLVTTCNLISTPHKTNHLIFIFLRYWYHDINYKNNLLPTPTANLFSQTFGFRIQPNAFSLRALFSTSAICSSE